MPFPDSKHLLRVWRATTRASLVREMEFRGNFIAGLIRQGLWLMIFVFMVQVIFNNTSSLAGWAKAEVLVIIALSRAIEGFMGIFFVQNIMELPNLVRDGKFDFHLTKPVPAQFYTAFRRANIDNLANVTAGLILLAYSLITLQAVPSLSTVLLFGVLSVAGIIIYYSLLIASASLVFFLERLEFLWGFNILLSEPLTVPFDIFPAGPRVVLTYLIPIAFVVFVPAQALTDRLDSWSVGMALLLAVAFFVIANLAWRAGLRRYTSASS